MTNRNLILFFVSIFLGANLYAENLPGGYPVSQRSKLKINADWRFYLGDPDADYYQSKLDDSNWDLVCVPHTLKLTSLALDGVLDDKTQPTFHREVGWYRKDILVGKDSNKKVFLEFEGAHQVTSLWVNGKKVGEHSVGGYSPFIFDISDFVTHGTSNQVTLKVDNRRNDVVPPDPGPFDYIKFSGLYRDVFLVETSPLRITFNIEALKAGVVITTPSVDPVNKNATINIKTMVKNESERPRNIQLVNRVVDADGLVVLKLQEKATIEAGREMEFNQIGGIEENLHLWDIDNPYLYKVNTMIVENNQVIDVVDNPLGIRKFELIPETGFRLNGKDIELIGFNRHQHYGYIGDALPNSLHYKDMLQFKQLGFNVMRCAHYPHDDEIIRACDELGILVYEEAPTWITISQKSEWYQNVEQAARVMVRNHRNHPSVVIWGAGINHRGYVPSMHYAIKQEDPTRLTASQSSRWTGWQASGLTDIFANMNYGPGIWDRSEPLFAMEGRSGPAVIAEYKRDPMKPGMISWTAHAYYTFHDIGKWDDRTRSGALNVFRYARSHDVLWYPSELVNKPYIHIAGSWEEDIEVLTIYSNAEEIELLVNDESVGTFKPSSDEKYKGLDHPPFEIPVDFYENGKLTAKGYFGGEFKIDETIFSEEKPYAVRLWFDMDGRDLVADGSDIVVGYAEIVDKNGMVLRNEEPMVEFSINGNGEIVGDGMNIEANPAKARKGCAPILIRTTKEPGEIVVTAKSKGLKKATASIQSVAAQNNMILANAYPIFDYDEVKVDLGAEDQLLQFDWLAWNGVDHQASEISIDALGGFEAKIKPASENGIIRWLGEMNVIGYLGFAYGEGVLGIDKNGLVLSFNSLPAGKYKIKTYHHAPRSNTNSMDPNKDRLKTLKIPSLAYASSINIQLNDANGSQMFNDIKITEGKERQYEKPGTFECVFESDGSGKIELIFNDVANEKGIWLNAFELRQN